MKRQYRVIRSVNSKYSVGTTLFAEADGCILIDLGYGEVRVNPKYLSCVEPVVADLPSVVELHQIEMEHDKAFLRAHGIEHYNPYLESIL